MNLNGEIVIITGGSGLLGSQYCKAIKEIGGTPVNIDINNTQGTEDCWSIYCDITKEEDVIHVKEYLKHTKLPIYGLINNAALNPKVEKDSPDSSNLSLEEYPSDFFDLEIATGLKGAFLCTKVFGSEMVKNKRGSIINISSVLGLVAPNTNFYDKFNVIKPVGYTVTKHAIIGLTKHTATEWAKYNVRCNCLCPGGVSTNQPENFVKELTKLIPLGKMAQKDSYNGIIKFLLCEESNYMTGSTIAVDGGFTSW